MKFDLPKLQIESSKNIPDFGKITLLVKNKNISFVIPFLELWELHIQKTLAPPGFFL